MKKFNSILFFAVMVTANCFAQRSNNEAVVYYPDSANRFVMQVEENFTIPNLSSSWKLKSEIIGYSGSGYMVWEGDGESIITKKDYNEESFENRMTFFVDISFPGVYYVKMRNYHYHEDGGPKGGNDFWASGNRSQWIKIYDHDAEKWSWDEGTVWPSYFFEEGINRIEIAPRSRGIALDRLVLFPESSIPEGWLTVKEWGTREVDWLPLDSTNWPLGTLLLSSDFELIVDSVPPQIPQIDTISTRSTTKAIKLVWNSCHDNVKLEGYKVFLNELPVNDILRLDTMLWIHNLSHNNSYHLRIEAIDWLGNKSTTATFIMHTKTDSSQITETIFPEMNKVDENFLIYPNPSMGIVTIRSLTEIRNGELEIYNMHQLVLKKAFDYIPDQGIILDIKHLPSGWYVLRFRTNYTAFDTKLVLSTL